MKKRNTKHALLLSFLSLLLCVSMLIGTTFAWFTDSVISGSNVIKSGSLDIVLEYWDGSSWINAEGKVIPFVAADGRAQEQILWEPGCTYEMAPFRVRSEGNLTSKFLILLNGVTGDEKLMEAITLKTRINNIPDSLLNGSGGNIFQQFEDAEIGILYGMPEGNVVFDGSLAGKGIITPGTGHTDTSPEFTIFGHMAEEAGNEYQGLSIEGISITVIATQETYETDSFNKYYDKDATFPELSKVVKVDSADALITMLGEVTEPVAIDATGVTLNPTSNTNTTVRIPAGVTLIGADFTTNSQSFLIIDGVGEDVVFEECTFNGADLGMFIIAGDDVDGANAVYENCVFKGQISPNFTNNPAGASTFNNCTFELSAFGVGYVNCMGGSHTFNNCTFNYVGGATFGSNQYTKWNAVNSYSESYSTSVVLNGCTRNNCGTHIVGSNGTLTVN